VLVCPDAAMPAARVVDVATHLTVNGDALRSRTTSPRRPGCSTP
jgi:hypothetical protein